MQDVAPRCVELRNFSAESKEKAAAAAKKAPVVDSQTRRGNGGLREVVKNRNLTKILVPLGFLFLGMNPDSPRMPNEWLPLLEGIFLTLTGAMVAWMLIVPALKSFSSTRMARRLLAAA